MLFPQFGYSFEDFVLATGKIRSKERLLEHLVETIAVYGYDRLNFTIRFDDQLPTHEHGFGIISTYSEPWQQYYAERNFMAIDPVLRCATSAVGPFTWKELELREKLSKQQRRFFRLGEEAGLYNGLGFPFNGARAKIAGVAVATSTRLAERVTNRDFLAGLCNQFYCRYKDIIGKDVRIKPSMVSLTPRESEVLQWIAWGKTDDYVANALSISINTVGYFLREIFRKLNATNRVQAVVIAISSGLIDL